MTEDNEKLIEAKERLELCLANRKAGIGAWSMVRPEDVRTVLDALAVFEKAHTPTDDEVNSLTKQFADRIFAAGLRAPESTTAVIVFKEIAAGFRRSEPNVCGGCHGLKGAHFSTCPGPQGESSDAQEVAAARAIYGGDPAWGYVVDYGQGEVGAHWEDLGQELQDEFRHRARAALCAASEVGGEGR